MDSSSISRQLAEFVHDLSPAGLPEEVMVQAKTLILDALAAAIPGRRLPYPSVAARVVGNNSGKATILNCGTHAPALDAAFVNALTINSIGQDDMLFMFHPGTVVIPAALAVAEEMGSPGAEVIAAVTVGYDVMGRVSVGAPGIVPRFRGVPVFGPLGAAAAAGRLFRLDQDQLVSALGYAANLSSGLAECWNAGTMEGKFHSGLASRNGVMAAILGREGATAAESTFEGKSGFYQAFSSVPADIEAVTKDLGKRFLIMEARVKPYPVCGLQQAPIDLIATFVKATPLKPEEICTIVEKTSEEDFFYPGSNNPGPFRTRFQATMSAQFCAAAAFLGKPMRSYSFYDREHNDPGIAEMAKKVELVGEKGRDRITIEVGLTDGRHYCIEGGGEELLLAGVDKTRLKFEALAYELIGKKRGEEIIDAVLNLERLRDIRELTALLGE